MRKSYRVKREKEFSQIFHKGKNFANRQFALYVLPNDYPHFRVGLSVGKRIGNAVHRNLVKRRIRQALLDYKALIKAKDFIIIARKPAACLTQEQTNASLKHLLTLSQLMDKESKEMSVKRESEH